MTHSAWQGVPYLEILRPDPGWKVEHAVIATYSADLVAVVAAMLALSGLDDDRGSGSKVDFANAYERLKGRLRVLVQAGRVASPTKPAPIMAIIDQFIKEVPADEKELSWHPKAVLVKYLSTATNETHWRLWIGSKNLTADMSWDTGLSLVSAQASDGLEVPGIDALGSALYKHAQLPEVKTAELVQELRKLRWLMPAGFRVEDVKYLRPDQPGRVLPPEPDGIKRLLIASPFLDRQAIDHFGRWGGEKCERWLLSSRDQLDNMARLQSKPLQHYQKLFVMDSPELDPGAPIPKVEAASSDELDPDEVLVSRGLHAKIVAAKTGPKWTMWVGSANATARGWLTNHEIVVRLTTDSEGMSGLLKIFEEVAQEAKVHPATPAMEESDEDRLEDARKDLVADWQLVQKRFPDGPLLIASCPPPITDRDIFLSAGLIGTTTVAWQKDRNQLKLPRVEKSSETELVEFVLTLGTLESRWIRRVPLDPPPGNDRDQEAIANYLDPRTFLAWIREILNDYPINDGGGAWNEPIERGRKTRPLRSDLAGFMPTLEEMLKAWARDPLSIHDVDKKVQRYLQYYLESDKDRDHEVDKALTEFGETWRTIRQELLRGAVK